MPNNLGLSVSDVAGSRAMSQRTIGIEHRHHQFGRLDHHVYHRTGTGHADRRACKLAVVVRANRRAERHPGVAACDFCR